MLVRISVLVGEQEHDCHTKRTMDNLMSDLYMYCITTVSLSQVAELVVVFVLCLHFGCHSLSYSVAEMLIHAFITTQLDHCSPSPVPGD